MRSTREADVVVNAKGAAQTKSAVTLLQERLSRLEAAARRQGIAAESAPGDPRTARLGLSPIEGSSTREADAPTTATPVSRSKSTDISRRNHMRSNTQHGLDLLSLGAMAEPTRRTGEILRELSIPRLISAVTEVSGGNPERSQRIDGLWDCVAKDIKRPTPEANRPPVPLAEGMACLETYFEHVDYRYPCIFKQDVELGMRALCRESSASDPVDQASHSNTFFALMVIAIVPLVVDGFSSAHGSFVSIHMLSRALQRLEDIFQMDDGPEIIQCLCLLVIYSLQNNAAGSSWHLCGFAMKKCIALGYHREPEASDSLHDERRREKNRWVFWSCYWLDRLICTYLGRPYSIEDAYVTVKFPAIESSIGLSGSVSRQVHIFRYARLMSEVVEDGGRRPLRHHLSRLMHWRSTIPDQREKYPEEQQGHLKSIYDTLLLRTMIDQIVYGYTEESLGDRRTTLDLGRTDTTTYSAGSDRTTISSSDRMGSHVRDSDLYSTCKAVVSSLTRASMRDRAFLSWLTGYSAFSAALCLLYAAAKGGGALSATSPMLPLAAQAMDDHRRLPYDVPSPSVFEQYPLQGALEVMSIVGRHFPRMSNTYRRVVLGLYDVICHGAHRELQPLSLLDSATPDHLRRLATLTQSIAIMSS